MRLIVMCGIPGAGKSTIVKKLKGYIICPDTIRGQISGSEDDQSRNAKVFNIAYNRLTNALKSNRTNTVIFDATNTSEKARREILKHCSDDVEKIAVSVETSLDEAICRNNKRDRKVPEEVIRRMHDRYVQPSVREGFDKVIII